MTAETPRTTALRKILSSVSASAAEELCLQLSEELERDLTAARAERDHWKAARDMALSGGEILMRERDAARARVAELEAGLLDVARRVESLKLPCGENPESPQAIRNGAYMSIVWVARALLAPSPEPRT